MSSANVMPESIIDFTEYGIGAPFFTANDSHREQLWASFDGGTQASRPCNDDKYYLSNTIKRPWETQTANTTPAIIISSTDEDIDWAFYQFVVSFWPFQ